MIVENQPALLSMTKSLILSITIGPIVLLGAILDGFYEFETYFKPTDEVVFRFSYRKLSMLQIAGIFGAVLVLTFLNVITV